MKRNLTEQQIEAIWNRWICTGFAVGPVVLCIAAFEYGSRHLTDAATLVLGAGGFIAGAFAGGFCGCFAAVLEIVIRDWEFMAHELTKRKTGRNDHADG